ncbi:MAG: hypothetical protein H8E38_00095 [SAR324 cluster bacterium]|nr:hypothetical protein [SAR324 cluster bacterium]
MAPQQYNLLPGGPLTTPILFLIFNRPETTEQVFSAIRDAKPPRLYVAADGPRSENPNEAECCDMVRSIASNVDWDCEVKTLFRDQNLGCRLAVSQAISWFFENEPEGIILEDDCLPSQSFFWFCQDMLDYFRNDKEVGAICGFYSNELEYKPSASFFYSRYLRVWGWAGWRRSFEGYDSNINLLIEKQNTWKKDMYSSTDIILKSYWQDMFEEVGSGKIDTWDVQLQYLLWQKKQMVVVSSNNLIQNIGWVQGAHVLTKDHNHELATSDINFPLTGPETTERDTRADQVIEKISYRITIFSYLKTLLRKMIR